MQRTDPLFEIKAILIPCIIMKMYMLQLLEREFWFALYCVLKSWKISKGKLKIQSTLIIWTVFLSFPYRVLVIRVLLYSLFNNNNNNNNNNNDNNNIAIFQRATPIHLRLRECTWVRPKPAWTWKLCDRHFD